MKRRFTPLETGVEECLSRRNAIKAEVGQAR